MSVPHLARCLSTVAPSVAVAWREKQGPSGGLKESPVAGGQRPPGSGRRALQQLMPLQLLPSSVTRWEDKQQRWCLFSPGRGRGRCS